MSYLKEENTKYCPKYAWILVLLLFSYRLSATPPENKIRFIENKNQWDISVRFRADIPGGKLYLQEKSLIYSFYDTEASQFSHGHRDSSTHTHPIARNQPEQPGMINMHTVAVEFLNAQTPHRITGNNPGPTYYNYFLSEDTARWATHVLAYENVVYSGLYDGINFKMYSSEHQLKYDFMVAPHANPEMIQLKYQGANVWLEHGNLYVRTSLGEMIEQRPYAYQLVNGQKKEVPCAYILENNILSFSFPQGFDDEQELVIDPLLIFSTYSGSLSDNWGNTATFDEAGNLYSAGIVFNSGAGFPVTPGAYQVSNRGMWDVGILKYDSAGSQLLYATYLGGGSTEIPHSLIINSKGELLVFGTTSSNNFPITAGAYQNAFKGGFLFYPFDAYGGITYANGSDLFIAKLNPDGSALLSSTYLGGSDNDGVNYFDSPLTRNYGDQFRGEVIVDAEDNVYIATNTASADFPVVQGFQTTYGGGSQDAVVVKMDKDLSQMLWSTYYGGNMVDAAFSIQLDALMNVYIAGGSNSANLTMTSEAFRTTLAGSVDGFAAKISFTGDSLMSSTFLGTPAYDQAYFIDLDEDENIYLLGQTQGNYAVSQGVYSNPNSGQFIQKLNNQMSISMLSTVFGSGANSPDISPTAFLVNECGNLLISGWGGAVNSPSIFVGNQLVQRNYVGGNTFGMPITDDADQPITDGSDFYMMVLEKDATSLLYATYFGGSASHEHVDGGTSRFDRRGIVYQAVCAGCGGNSDFPTTPGAWSNTNNSTNCNNAAFKYDLTTLDARLATNSPEGDMPGLDAGCFPLTILFLNRSIGGESFIWDLGDGTTTTQPDSIIHTYEEPGIYNIVLTAIDENTCLKEDFDYGTITVYEVDFAVIDSVSICFGEGKELSASGGVTYQWSPAQGLSNTASANPVASPDTTTTYNVFITDQNGCTYQDSVKVDVVPEIALDFQVIKDFNCESTHALSVENSSTGVEEILWDFGDGTISTETNPVHVYADSGAYEIKVVATSQQCVESRTIPIQFVNLFVPNVFTPNQDGRNDRFEIIYNEPLQLKIFNRWGKTLYTSENYQNNWDGDNLPAGVYYYELNLPNEETCKGWVHLLK
jgi:gliding motility-associated-like protein